MPDRRRNAAQLTKKEIVIESKIDDTDVAKARVWWRSHAPGQYKELLDAEPKPDDGTSGP